MLGGARRGGRPHGAPPGTGRRPGRVAGAGRRHAVRAAVRLTELAPGHPLFSAGGSTLSVLLHTDLMGTVQIAERDALPDQTAYAIYADLLAIHEGPLASGRPTRPARHAAGRRR